MTTPKVVSSTSPRLASIAIAEAAIKSAMRNSTADVVVVGFIAPNASWTIQFIVQSMTLEGETGKPPRGLTAFGVFLLWGASMAFLAAITLTWRGTILDRVWAINPTGHQQLVPLRDKAGILFAILGVTLAAAGIGWFKKLLWAWRLAISIIAAQVIGNIVNILLGRTLEGAVGITASGALLFYLLWRRVRAVFRKPGLALGNRDPGGP